MEAEIASNALGVNPAELGARVAVAFQGTLIIFAIIAPLMGGIFARVTEKRSDALIAWSIGMLIVLGVQFGMSYLLQSNLPTERLPVWAIQLLSMVTGLAVGGLVVRYVQWYNRPPANIWTLEFENRPEDELSIFDIKRKEWLERKKKAQHR